MVYGSCANESSLKINDRATIFKILYFLFLMHLFIVVSTAQSHQPIDIANIFPHHVMDLEATDSHQGRSDIGETFSQSYASPGEILSLEGHIEITLTELNRRALSRDPVGPGATKTRWTQVIDRFISNATPNVTEAQINNVYRVIERGVWTTAATGTDIFRVVMEVNKPGKRLVGFFRFYNYMCRVDAMHEKYATYEYFDEAFRLILEGLGWLKIDPEYRQHNHNE